MGGKEISVGNVRNQLAGSYYAHQDFYGKTASRLDWVGRSPLTLTDVVFNPVFRAIRQGISRPIRETWVKP